MIHSMTGYAAANRDLGSVVLNFEIKSVNSRYLDIGFRLGEDLRFLERAMREKITELTRNNSCMSCHGVINPLGFSLENFDAIGRWRVKDNNKPVNSVSDFSDEQGKKIHLTGPRDIVNYVADNPSGHRAFIRHLFNHIVKQQIPSYGAKTLDDLQRSFADSGCNIQKLVVEIALVATMDGVKTQP